MSLEGSVKLEPEWESEGEAAASPLFCAVKEELDLGPDRLQPPDVLYALQDIVKTEPEAHVKAEPGVACSVLLEPMLVDLKSETCTIGLQTYNFQLPHGNQESLEISLEEDEMKGSEDESSSKNKQHAIDEVKREEEENQNTSHQDISSKADIREMSSIKLPSTKIDRLGVEQNTVCEFATRSINDCKFCSDTFDTKLLLQEHEKSQHGVKYFTCSTFTENGDLKVALNTENKFYECKTTFAKYATKDACELLLTTHLRTHTGEKPFKCSWCKSAFTHKHNLRAHLRTHTGEKPFKCGQCSSAFNRSSNLQRHLRTHSGEKSFKCSQCSSAYSESSVLRIHLRTHTGEKPYECNICDYKTIQSGALKRHLMSRHSGQKPFACDACSYRGATRGNLRKHMKGCHKSQ